MKICTYILFIVLISTLSVKAQPFVNPSIKPNTAFKAGEKLTYQIRYGIIVGGITTLSLTNDIYDNKEVFHAVAIGKTTGMAEVIYGVNDVYESWFDKETNLSYKQIRDIKEGSYTKYNEVTYNRRNNTVNSQLSGEHSVPEKILDLATSLYYIRRIDFSKVNENEVIFVNIFFSDEIFPFYLRYKGKETIRTKFGKINCLKISPVVEVGRMFKTPNDVSIWITDDCNYLPVLIEMDIRIVGKIHLKLISYENIVNPMIIQ
ncbi:MAG: DUF3108 domain-containing protein [Bacteroidota bacterium]|nr:DUF3108 domain-containing protein [Bacteroidota bacterium]